MSKQATYRRALVTGGAGFIGSHLCRRLLQAGLEVVVLDDLSTGCRTKLDNQCEFVEDDLRNPSAVTSALRGVDIVFHNAARVSVRASNERFVEDAETNVMGTLVLLKAIASSGVKKLVLASSMAVYADASTADPIDEDHLCRPLSPYGTGKLATELYAIQICVANGIDVVPLRYFNTYGPGQAFTPYVGVVTIFTTQLLQGIAPTIFGDGSQTRDFVSVHDIVEANVCAMRAQVTGKVFNIGSGRGSTVLDVAKLLVDRIDPKASLKFGPRQPGEISNSVADIRRASDILGYAPSGCFAKDVDGIIASVRASLNTLTKNGVNG